MWGKWLEVCVAGLEYSVSCNSLIKALVCNFCGNTHFNFVLFDSMFHIHMYVLGNAID
jgi:hypothetical protein